MKTGRKRKTNVRRDKSGKSRGEALAVHPETLAIRNRQLESMGIPLTEFRLEGNRLVEKTTASNRLSGFTLGLLYLRGKNSPGDPGGISKEQYEAGEAWSRIVHRHAAIMGYKLRIHTPNFTMVSGGVSLGIDPTDEEIGKAKDRYRRCYDALAGAARDHGHRVQTITYAVCVDNLPVHQLTPACYGYLRVGLNALGKAV